MRLDIDECLRMAKEHSPDASKSDMAELRGYMLEFLADVDKEFPL
jgi:hypothetical protein